MPLIPKYKKKPKSKDSGTNTETGGSSPGGASTGGVGSGIGGAGTGGAATGGASTGGAGTVNVTISGNSGTGSNEGGKQAGGKGKGKGKPTTINISNVGGRTDAGSVASGDGPGSPGTGGRGSGPQGGGGAAPDEPDDFSNGDEKMAKGGMAKNLGVAYAVQRKRKKMSAGGDPGGKAEYDPKSVPKPPSSSDAEAMKKIFGAEGGMINAKNARRPMPDNTYDDSKMASRNSGNKPSRNDDWSNDITIKQAQKPSITKLSQPKIVGSDAFSVRNMNMRDEENDLGDSIPPETDKAQPIQRDNEYGPNRQGPKVSDMERQHKAKRAPYEQNSESQYSEDMANDNMKKKQSPPGRYAKGGEVDMPEGLHGSHYKHTFGHDEAPEGFRKKDHAGDRRRSGDEDDPFLHVMTPEEHERVHIAANPREDLDYSKGPEGLHSKHHSRRKMAEGGEAQDQLPHGSDPLFMRRNKEGKVLKSKGRFASAEAKRLRDENSQNWRKGEEGAMEIAREYRNDLSPAQRQYINRKHNDNYAAGGPVMEPEDDGIEMRERSNEAHLMSEENPSHDMGEADAMSRNELDEMPHNKSPDMERQHNNGRKAYARGGEVSPQDEMDEESHASIAAAIMSRRNRMSDDGSGASDEPINMADGGMAYNGEDSIYAHPKEDQADLRRNAEEDANMEDQSSFNAMRKENYSESEGLKKLDSPMDSGQHGDDIDSDEHDMISSIRSKMNMRRQFR